MDQRVSVIIPNFNHSQYLEHAVKSIVNQSVRPDAVVIVDDCSTDNSWEMIQKFPSVWGGINIAALRLEQNMGRSFTRNVGIKYSWDTSDVFAFLDADDFYEPDKIGKSIDILKEDPDTVGVVYSDFDAINVDTEIRVREFRPPFDALGMRQTCQINNDSIVNKKALAVCGLYDETMEVAEDYDLWLRVTRQFLAVHIPEQLLTVRITLQGASQSVSPQIWQKNWRHIASKYVG